MSKPAVNSAVPPLVAYIRQAQLVPGILPFSSATLWRKVKDGSFPAPIKLGDRIVAWRQQDIADWLEQRKGLGKCVSHASPKVGRPR